MAAHILLGLLSVGLEFKQQACGSLFNPEGVLTGDFSLIQDLTLPDLAARFLASGSMPQICATITKSDLYISDDPAQMPKNWEECSREECLGIILPFVIDITIGPLNLKNHQDPIPPLETSS